MTVKELHARLEQEIKQGREDYNVKIIVENTSMGGRASTNVKYASSGFDWESGQFNLVAEDKIVKLSLNVINNQRNINNIQQLNNLINPKNPE